MDFYTTVKCGKQDPGITYDSRLMLLGSCFTDNIGDRLRRAKFNVMVNPHGILYNPLSMSKALSEVMECRQYETGDLVFHGGLYHSMMHHGSFSDERSDVVLTNINRRIAAANSWLKEADWLVMTFGTSYIYKYGGEVVSNCHKLPEKAFERSLCPHETMFEDYMKLFDALFHINAKLKVIVTVSPIRHLRDGMHGNAVSKANLMMFVDSLMQAWPDRLCYFPSYEIMLDELRDYRFYASDMVHPSDVAIDYIWEKFTGMFMDKGTMSVMERCEAIDRMRGHRPINQGSAAHQSFLDKMKDEILAVLSLHPSLDFSDELSYISMMKEH